MEHCKADLHDRQKSAREEEKQGDIEVEKKEKIERTHFSQRTEEGSGMGLEWNVDGCRISRWRRIKERTYGTYFELVPLKVEC